MMPPPGPIELQTETWVRAFAMVLLLGLPVLASRTGIRKEQHEQIAAAREAVYLSTILSMAILAGVTILAAALGDIPAGDLGWRIRDPAQAFGWAVGATLIGVGLVALVFVIGRLVGASESEVALLLMPRTPRERLGFVLLALAAAVGEEFIYRGFLLHVLAGWWGGGPTAILAAVILTSLSFGVAHGYQRLLGMLRATLLGAMLGVLVVWTGSLFAAIVAHFWINALYGLWGWRLFFPDEASA